MTADARPSESGSSPLTWSSERHLRVSVHRGEAIAAASAIRGACISSFVDATPAYETVLLEFDAGHLAPEAAERHVEEILGSLHATGEAPLDVVEVPVCYEGEHAPDLEDVARETGLHPAEVVMRHSEPEYKAMFAGFMPGFAYLDGLPPALRVPRLDRPRVRVPAGSVGIGGDQTGVYPLASPGGWRLIGRTPRRMFDASRAEPALIRPGARVKFVPITNAKFDELQEPGPCGRRVPPVPPAQSRPVLRIVDPGMLTTVQDLGRPGWAELGVVSGGAADPLSLRIGNRLVGNGASAAALELTLSGATLEFILDAVVAITGADADVQIESGEQLSLWQAFRVAKGRRLRIGRARRGVRTYVCIAGGVDVPEVLSGRGTHLTAGFGGFQGRKLAKEDILDVGEQAQLPRPLHASEIDAIQNALFRKELTCVRGPQMNVCADISALWSEFRVSAHSDRVGIRLEGANSSPRQGGRMVSEGVMWGAVQIPEDGNPIVLGVDHPTTGGYPVAAVVTAADLPALGQLAPGDRIRLRLVSLEHARAAAKRLNEVWR